MTESKSKWDAAAGLKTLWRPAAAAWIAVMGIASAQGSDSASAPVEPSSAVITTVSVGGAPVTAHSSASIRSDLASVAASAFEPAHEGIVDLATFGTKTVGAALNVPPPGSISPVEPPTDHIPEPGTIGFGLAVAALIFGNFAKALKRCWKITSTTPGREL